MKQLLILCCCLSIMEITVAQNKLNMTQLSNWDDNTLPIASPGNLMLQYSGCWGLAVNGREYAVLGGAAHVLFFDVTNPADPTLVGKFQGESVTVWREFKSYKNRVYAVSDNTSEGLMIFDLSNAQDTIVRTYWSEAFFNSAHTITLDTTSGRIYLNGGTAGNGIIVLDVSQNPDQPVLLGHPTIQGGYVHDSYVRNDTLYCSSGNDGYYIFDFKDPDAPVLLANVSTGGYNHNSWLNSEGTYAYYTEEVPKGLPIRIVDLKNLTTGGGIEVVGSFLDNLLNPTGVKEAIAHNVYVKDNLLFDSQYEDGLLVYDISEPTIPKLVAYYDTHPQNTVYNTYFGNWGNYPWLPSGNIIAGDMQNGLFMLRLDSISTGIKSLENSLPFSIVPNPATDEINIQTDIKDQVWAYTIMQADGRTLISKSNITDPFVRVNTTKLSAGLYWVSIITENGQQAMRKLSITR